MDQDVSLVARQLALALEDAWNAADAVGFAAYFAEDADFVHILGGHGQGRAAIAAAHEALFAGIYRASRVAFEVVQARALSPDALVVLLTQRLTYGAAAEPKVMICRPSLVVVREGGDWRIVLMQNTRTAESAPEGLAAHPFAPKSVPETTP